MYHAQSARAQFGKLGPSPARILTRPLHDFLAFRRFVTPQVIQIAFWFGVAYSVIAGLTLTVAGLVGGGIVVMLAGLLMLALGPIAVRVACELALVLFRIGEMLTEARNNALAGGDSTPAAQAA